MTLQVNVLKFWKATQHSIFLTSTAPIIEYLSFCKLVINMKPNHASKTICLTFLLLQAGTSYSELPRFVVSDTRLANLRPEVHGLGRSEMLEDPAFRLAQN